jgi:proline iminopeptidase
MYLDVGDVHSLYFEEYGNPKGIKILFLHGGPGLGFSDQDKAIFDSNKFQVIFIDQRGCGKSLPKGELVCNTTLYLVEDIDKVLDHLEIDSIVVFGGSWGATLAVLYAASSPNKVSKLILRGVFPATKECTDILI